MVFAPSSVDSYAGSMFPGLVDTLYDIESSEDLQEQWITVRKHLATLEYIVDAAATTLKPVTNFNN